MSNETTYCVCCGHETDSDKPIAKGGDNYALCELCNEQPFYTLVKRAGTWFLSITHDSGHESLVPCEKRLQHLYESYGIHKKGSKR